MYTIEDLYNYIIHKKPVAVHFKMGTTSYRQLGDFVTVTDFNLNNEERILMGKRVLEGDRSHGKVSVKILAELNSGSLYKDAMIDTNDIEEIEA